MQWGLGTEKGGVGGYDSEGNLNTVIQDPFVWNAMTENRSNYSGEKIVEAASAGLFTPAWTPVVGNKVVAITAAGVETEVSADTEGKYTLPANTVKVKYVHDNQYMPQTKLPTIVGKMQAISLTARARRIAIVYNQFTAYQSKTDYGINFESTIAQQAQSELQYETDSEAIFMIKNAADALSDITVTWVDEELDTIGYSIKAEGFARAIEKAKMIVYKKTNRFQPNWMLVSPDIMPILTFVPGFKAANNSIANGPYIAGNIAGLKVIVTPALGDKVCYLGVLGNDGKTAVGVYAPYLPLIPTQLLGFADGTMQQGFSSMYDMKILNRDLLAKIEVVEGDGAAAIFKI